MERNFSQKTRKELLSILNQDESIPLGNIDVSQIEDMSYVFCNLATCEETYINECMGSSHRLDFRGIETWDVGKVKNMTGMFLGNEDFNAPIQQWRVIEVENMESMFEGARSFNQDLSSWKVPKLKEWKDIFKDSPLENDKSKQFQIKESL